MDKQHIHRQLKRQINKYLSDDFIADNDALSKFIDVVNLSYFHLISHYLVEITTSVWELQPLLQK